MIFNSLIFVVFFAIVLFLHATPFPWRVKKINLLIANYIFYAAWNPPFVMLLWLSTVVDWFAARGLAQAEEPWKRRAWMLLSVVVSLGLLCYFKYGHFLIENFAHLASLAGFPFICAAQRVRPPELARRLNTSPQAVNRLVNLRYSSKIDGIDQALKALGKTLEVQAI
jgi:hypothetical protein